jgi:uncharacterized lipoprotein YmbA
MKQRAEINSVPARLVPMNHVAADPALRERLILFRAAEVRAFLRGLLQFRAIVALGACLCLTGCFGFLKPTASTARHFVLTPLPATEAPASAPGAPAIGVAQVKLPAYLFNSSLAIRKGTNEIEYSQATLWAERLDTAIQRTLAANLAASLHTEQIRLSSWRKEDVSVEVYVAIEQFDVNAGGEGVLVGWWRILAPGGAKVLKSGVSRLQRHGPPPDTDPSGAVATLSGLLGDLSRQLAQAVNETAH